MGKRYKRANIFLLIILLSVTTDSIGQRQASNNDLITVDVRKTYSQKKELILQDFMDVEYIALETTDEFLCQGIVLDIGKKIIVLKNRINDGNIFIYDRNGKALRKINNRGQGPQEYTNISGLILDEDNGELIVNDRLSLKLLVYDLFGKFKRSIKHQEGLMYDQNIYNYDKNNFICYNILSKEKNIQKYLVISKHDGSLIHENKIQFIEKKHTFISQYDEAKKIANMLYMGTHYPIIPYEGKWILVEPSSDTIFQYIPDKNLIPFLIRTPSVQSMKPEEFLFLNLLTDRYYFMEIVKKTVSVQGNIADFPRKDLVFDKKEKAIFNYSVLNNDFSDKRYTSLKLKPINKEIAFSYIYEAYRLVDDYKNKKLKDGKLKEIASKLDAEDNPVIMLVKHKK